MKKLLILAASVVVTMVAVSGLASSARAAYVYDRVAGTYAASGFSGDGGPAVAARLSEPNDVAPLAGGGYLIVDSGNRRIRRVDPSGIITTVAGTGSYGHTGDGGLAIFANFNSISSIEALPDSGFIFTEIGVNETKGWVRYVDPDGVLHTLAGGGSTFLEGAEATSVSLKSPDDVEVLPGGGFLVSDTAIKQTVSDPEWARVYLVDPDGKIHTVAGGGESDGRSGLATDANLTGPGMIPSIGIEPIPEGGFYVAAADRSEVFKVNASGLISSVAGTGEIFDPNIRPYPGEGGPATSAPLTNPTDVVAGNDGAFIVFDPNGQMVHEVDSAGITRTIAGPGYPNIPGDACFGRPATGTAVYSYRAAAMPNGGFIGADLGNQTVTTLTERAPDPSQPNAVLSLSTNRPAVGASVTMNAEGSTDCYGIAGYDWDFEGDGIYDQTTATNSVTTTYADRGNYSPTVRVRSSGGGSATKQAGIAVGPLGISINDGAVFTNNPNVSLRVVYPPSADNFLIANDGGFGGASSVPPANQVSWTLQTSGPERLPKSVYLRFEGSSLQPEDRGTITDDIILDQTAPVVGRTRLKPVGRSASFFAVPTLGMASSMSLRNKKPRFSLSLRASDNASGINAMQITAKKPAPGKWKPYKATTKVILRPAALYVRVMDGARNVSKWKKVPKPRLKKRAGR